MDILLYISPELILTITALVVLGLDLFWRERAGERLGWIALAGAVLALIATLVLFIPGRQFAVFCSVCANAGAQDLAQATASQVKDALYVSDNFTNFFRLVAIVAGIVLIMASFDYLRGRTQYRGEFFGLFLLAVVAMILMAGSTNLLMIYLSTEFLSYTSYILTGFLRDNKKSNEASIKYFLYGAVTSATMLYGISLFYGATGSLNLAQIGEFFHSSTSTQTLALFATALMLTGFGFKISLVPFHQWAPDAYEGAPTPVTAFLSVGPKAAGFAILLRVLLAGVLVYQDGWVALLALISIFTMTLGNIIALTESNVKRLLAYSSIAQAGYILIGVVSLALGKLPFDGVNGVLIYLLAYLFTNLGAFLVIIAIENATGAVDISQYNGMIRRAPFLAAMLVFFFLSLAGIPPTAGFIGKFFVFAAALQVGQGPLAAIGVINSLVSVFYYFRVIRPMFFEPPSEETPIRTSVWLNAGLIIAGAMTLLIAIYPTPLYNLATNSATAMFGLAR
jgi:proton-translocating NADH-quinone oxidoreductase chain N